VARRIAAPASRGGRGVGQYSVTVVMPTNRGGPFIRDAVTSVARQTAPVAEVILVDDGSPARGLSDLARQLGVKYLRQPASGISVARNTGVKAATSDWIAFLDDDDVWHPERICAQLKAIEGRPGAIASHTGGWFMDAAGMRFGDDWRAPDAEPEDLISARVAPPRITTLLVRRDAYLEVGGCDPTTEPAEDNDLILRLLQRGPFAAVDKALVGYRRHSANVTLRGLSGRSAGLHSIRRLRDEAERRGDRPTAALLQNREQVFLAESASENLGEFLAATRGLQFGYAASVAWWGLSRAPRESARALRERTRRRGRR
jgi:glycosyltransferase involved in cell wall biosynthesis